MKLSIQIVNFRSRHYLRRCLFSIGENLPAILRTEVIIVNNDEKPLDRDIADIGGGFSVQIVEIGKNVGFGRAQNAGFQQSRGEYILFLNPDTKILPGALQALLNIFEKNEQIGIAGALLVDSTGKIQSDCFGSRHTPLSTVKRKISKRSKRQEIARGEIFETDWVSGGAMLVRRDVFEETGGFDEKYFVYFEDADLCLRVKKKGLKIAVIPSALVFHESGKSFASVREKKKHYYASQDYYTKKHFGSAAAGFVRLLRLPYYIKNVYLSR
jgi:GT2 family glycosyltransferase